MEKLLTVILIVFLTFKSLANDTKDSIHKNEINLYGFINDWLGTKYKFGGYSKTGIDCSGFTKKLYESVFTTKIPRTAKEQYKVTKKVPFDSLNMGDLVFFRTKSGTTWHVGVYLFSGIFVHSGNKKTGVHVTSINNPYYYDRFLNGGRLL